MVANRIVRAALVAICLALLPAARSSAATTQQRLDLATVTNAHYRAHRLLGNCMTSTNALGANRQSVESYIQILEAVELTQSVAAQYRLTIVKIELGVQYFAQAKQATGKKRTNLVALANETMRAAAALLDLAVRFFNQVQPQLVRYFAAAQQSGGRERKDGNKRKPDFPIPLTSRFGDCVPERLDPRRFDPGCCRNNLDQGLLILEGILKDLSEAEKTRIEECLKDTEKACRRALEANLVYRKREWEECFEGYVIFR